MAKGAKKGDRNRLKKFDQAKFVEASNLWMTHQCTLQQGADIAGMNVLTFRGYLEKVMLGIPIPKEKWIESDQNGDLILLTKRS